MALQLPPSHFAAQPTRVSACASLALYRGYRPPVRGTRNRQTMSKRNVEGIYVPENVATCNGKFLVASASTGSEVTAVGRVKEVTSDTFWSTIEAAGDKLVVLDMYTQWCGPCKIMLPKVVSLSEKYSDILFLKLDCNHENRSLAKELGVRVVPTFKLFKNKLVIAEVTGARFDKLVEAIKEAREGLP